MANLFLLAHDSCEHTGDIDNDHKVMRAAGLKFKVLYVRTCHGPEEGASLIETSATQAQVVAAADASCIRYVEPATGRADVDNFIAQTEAEWKAENESSGW
jgi:hypothetical protein